MIETPISVNVGTLLSQACAALESALRARGCGPTIDNDDPPYHVGMADSWHVICSPIPAEGAPYAVEGLMHTSMVDGSPIEDITPEHIRKMADAAADIIVAHTKRPIFGRLYVPRAIDSADFKSNGAVGMRFAHAYDPVRCMFQTRFDMVFKVA